MLYLQEEISLSSCEVFVDPFEEAEAKVSCVHDSRILPVHPLIIVGSSLVLQRNKLPLLLLRASQARPLNARQDTY